MTKLHLPACVPNEGARLLAWWINTHAAGTAFALRRLDEGASVDAPMADRLLTGDILPGAEMGHFVWLATDGKVPTKAWRRRSRGGWFDRPTEFHEQEARKRPPAVARAGEVFAPLGTSPAPVREMHA